MKPNTDKSHQFVIALSPSLFASSLSPVPNEMVASKQQYWKIKKNTNMFRGHM
jgi:hypothetical protein